MTQILSQLIDERQSFGKNLQSIMYLVAIFIAVMSCSAVYIVLLLFLPKEFLWRYWVRPCAWSCLRVAGQRIVVIGTAPLPGTGPYLYLLNHESFLDSLMMAYAIKHRAVPLAAKNFFKIPVWGQMMKSHGIIPVNRYDRIEALASVSEAEKAISRGESIIIFPEGQRTIDGELNEFKKGAFHLAKNTGVTIVPCVIYGAYQSWRRNSLQIKSGTIILRFLEPIPSEEYLNNNTQSDIAVIADLVKTKIKAGKMDLSIEHGGR